MREAGLVVARALPPRRPRRRPVISTADLDAIAEREIRAAGAVPSFLGYHGYPGHDLHLGQRRDRARHPQPGRRLAAGDLLSIDCGAIAGGWHGDAAVTVGVGPVSAETARLVEACEPALGTASRPQAGRVTG